MIPQLVTADLARVLGAQRQGAGVQHELATLLGLAVVVVGVPRGERWEGAAEGADRVAIVLDGTGTIVVDDWRATVGPGLAVGVPARRRVSAVADGATRVELMLVGPAPEPPEHPAPAPEGDAPPPETPA